MEILAKRFLYFDSKSIKKNDIIWGLLENGIDVERARFKCDMYNASEEDINAIILEMRDYDIAISQDFSFAIAEGCKRIGKPYISWVYDSPQIALFRKEALYDTNYIFMFEKTGIEEVKAKGVNNIYYLPLAANITQTSMLNITDEDIDKYQCDLSFVGNLYKKEYMDEFLSNMPAQLKKQFDTYISDGFCSWYEDRPFDSHFSDELVDYTYACVNKTDIDAYSFDKRFFVETLTAIYEKTNQERIAILNSAADICNVRLYTSGSTPDNLHVQVFPKVDYETDMYKVFFASKINLNITYRGIKTGVPQRIFDIMAVGGFCLTNYQQEVAELFEIGKEIDVYHDEKELQEKIRYYLSHEKERVTIGINGYHKVKELYNYKRSVYAMLMFVDGKLYK